MQEAVPVGAGAMAAILGASLDVVKTVCDEASEGQVCTPANINSPSQIVIAGDARAIDRAIEALKARGAKRAIKLNVSAPFHCTLMLPAQERLAFDLESVSFHDLSVPLVTNVDADTIEKGEEARNALVRQVSMPVRWEESIRLMIDEGVNTFVEVGPGRVLTGLLRQIERSVAALNIEDEKSLITTLEKIAAAKADAA